VLALLGRSLFGSWLAPGAFFALYWAAALGAPVLFAPAERVGVTSLLWVFAAAGAVWVGSYLGGGLRVSPEVTEPRETTSHLHARRALAFAAAGCAALGMGAPMVPLFAQGYGLQVFTSFRTLVTAAVELSIGRYSETYVPPLLGQAALPFVYAGPAFGGALAALGGRRAQRLVAFVPFVPALLMTVTQTQRAVTVLATVVWISSYLAARVLARRVGLFTRRHVVAGILVGASVLAMAVAVALVRIGSLDVIRVSDVTPSIHGGLFGHATVFGQWFDAGGAGAASPTWGAFTFAALYDVLGLGQRRPGLFAESVVLSTGDETNLYTLFRPLIDDFTPLGALLALLALGAVGGLAFRAALRGRLEAVPVLAGFYATTLYGFVTSIWIYNSTMAAFVIFFVSSAVASWRFRQRAGPAGARASR
jgi:oligosaccharide repeat unit polymerase